MKKKKAGLLLRLLLVIVSVAVIFLGIVYLSGRLPYWNDRYIADSSHTYGVPTLKGFTVYGIDVSYHQGKVHWQKLDTMGVKGKEFRFVFLKATEGITRQDPDFQQNWPALKKTSLVRGAYHFFYPSRDPILQAENFIRQVKLENGDLPPVADIEHTNGKSKKVIQERLEAFLTALEKAYGVKPIIYTNHSFYKTYLSDKFSEYPLWISDYNGQDRFNARFDHPWVFWQYSDRGRVHGIRGYVDLNVFNGNKAQFRRMLIQ